MKHHGCSGDIPATFEWQTQQPMAGRLLLLVCSFVPLRWAPRRLVHHNDRV